MEEYSVLDIFSYVPKQKIDLEQLETIFVNEINNVNAATNGYYVEKYKQIHELEKNIKIAVEDLQNEGKKVAFIIRSLSILLSMLLILSSTPFMERKKSSRSTNVVAKSPFISLSSCLMFAISRAVSSSNLSILLFTLSSFSLICFFISSVLLLRLLNHPLMKKVITPSPRVITPAITSENVIT